MNRSKDSYIIQRLIMNKLTPTIEKKDNNILSIQKEPVVKKKDNNILSIQKEPVVEKKPKKIIFNDIVINDL